MLQRFCLCCTCLFFCVPADLFADTLSGVVRDERLQPVAGARIDIATAVPKVMPNNFGPSSYLDCRKWTRTNENGEFAIEGLDPKLKFRIVSTAPGKQTKLTDLIDPSKDTAQFLLPDFPNDTPATQILVGTIVNTDGAPIPGALIEAFGAKTSQMRWWGRVEAQPAVSDDNGQFRMLITGMNYEGIDVEVLADGYGGVRNLLLRPGHEPHVITVPNGTSLTGRLIYKGQPQAGQRIAVVQTKRNEENPFIKSVLAITNSDGQFEFNNLLASQPYAIFSPVGEADPQNNHSTIHVLTTKKFNCRADNETRDLGDLELIDSYSISGKLEMNDGAQLPDGLRMILSRNPAWDLILVPVDPDGNFNVEGLAPETYQISISSKEVQIDASRLNYQLLRPNTFGMRLKESREGILIPLVRQDAAAQMHVAKEKWKSDSAARKESADPAIEIEQSNAGAPGGGRIAVELPDEPVPPDGPRLAVSGTVITSNGQRIAGATLILRANIGGTSYSTGLSNNRDILARSKSNADGRFLFSRVPIPLRLSNTITSLMSDRGGVQLLCYAEGYALTAIDIPSFDNKERLRVVLSPEADVRGTIRDGSGKGIPGAQIELIGTTTTFGRISPVLSGPSDLNLNLSQVDRISTADNDGRFVIKHMPKNRRLIVAVTADHYARQVMAIETAVPVHGIAKRTDELMVKDRISVQQSPVEVTLAGTPVAIVRVVDHEGNPVNDGEIAFTKNDGTDRVSYELKAVSSGTVTVAIQGSDRARLRYVADLANPRVGVFVTIDDFKADPDHPYELRLPEPRWITGRVVNLETGEPVVGAEINASARSSVMMHSHAVSGDRGLFRIPVGVGKNQFFLRSSLSGFVSSAQKKAPSKALAVVEVAEKGELPEVMLKLNLGLIIEGVVSDETGKPIANTAVRAEQIQGQYHSVAARTNSEGKYRITGLFPSEETLLSVSTGATSDRVTIGGVDVKEENQVRHETVDMVVKAGIQLAGRVLKNGMPQSGVKMRLSRSVPGDQNRKMFFAIATTDDDGRYLVGGLDPGDLYSFNIETRDNSTAPGWVHQLTDLLNKIPDNAEGVIELPNANLVGSDQSLAGIVVDPDNNPVADINVLANLKNGRSIARRESLPSPSTQTDKSGRFELTQLPDEEIELFVYRPTPAGQTIEYPAKMKPQPNQTDIRIVLDLTLLGGVEDIDQEPMADQAR